MNYRPQKDIWLDRMIIAALGVTVTATMAGAILRASTGISIPGVVIATGLAAVGVWAVSWFLHI